MNRGWRSLQCSNQYSSRSKFAFQLDVVDSHRLATAPECLLINLRRTDSPEPIGLRWSH